MRTIDPEFIRTYPGMFIGNIGSGGLHYLLFGLLDDSTNEARLGFSQQLKLTVLADGSVRVMDDGRTIEPQFLVELFAKMRTEINTDLDTKRRDLSRLHGSTGIALNALSERCEVLLRDGNRFRRIRFSRGILVENWSTIANPVFVEWNVVFEFRPDHEIFGEHNLQYELIRDRLRILSFLHPRLKIDLYDQRSDRTERFHSSAGLLDFVEHLNAGRSQIVPLHPPISFCSSVDGIEFEGAIQYSESSNSVTQTYVNNRLLNDGGDHIAGIRSGLTRTWKKIFRGYNHHCDSLVGEDFRENLTLISKVVQPNPSFRYATWSYLLNPELTGIASRAIDRTLTQYTLENPAIIDRMYWHFNRCAEVRIQAKNLRLRSKIEKNPNCLRRAKN